MFFKKPALRLLTLLVFLFVNTSAFAQASDLPKASQDESFNKIERDIAQFNVTERDFQILTEILAKYPEDCYAHFLLCRCFERKGLLDMAGEELALVHKLETSPQDILRRMRHHIEAGELSEAFTMAPMALEKSPGDPSVLLLRAIFQQNNGLTDSAESVLQTLLFRKDCPLGAATALASIRLEQKRFYDVLGLADRDIRLNPGYLGARMVKGQALLALGRFSEIISTLKDSLAEHPFSQRLNVLLYEAYRRQGRLSESLHCALRNLACSDYITYYEHAQLKVKDLLQKLPASRSESIIKEESRMISRTAYAMKFHFLLGQVYFKMGKGKEAREQLQQALLLDSLFQPNWYEMGRIKEVFFGDFGGAARDFQQARVLQRSDLKAGLAFMRVTARLRNQRRDLALSIKNKIRRTS